MKLDLLGFTWIYLDLPGFAWIYPRAPSEPIHSCSPPPEHQFAPSPIASHEEQVGGGALLSCFPAFLINQENRKGRREADL